MFKILIVDDERIERKGLRAMLKNGLPDLVIEEAPNGSIAVELASSFRPDLILMDIKMPGMNGFETVERISAEHPDCRYIMVTALDTFEYARQALKLGVKDYLLKPSKAREIVETVGRVLEQIEVDQKSIEIHLLQQKALKKTMPLVETDVVTQLLYNHVHEVHLDDLVGLLDIRAANEMFAMNVILPTESESLYTAVKEKARQGGSCWVGAMNGRQIPIIVFRDANRSFRTQALSLAREMISVGKSDRGAGWFLGIGNVCSSFQQIRQSYQESLVASMDTSLAVRNRFYEDVPKGYSSEFTLQSGKQREKQLLEHIRLGQWDSVHANLVEIIGMYEQDDVNLVLTQQRMLEFLWVASRMLNDMGVEGEAPIYTFQAQDYRQLRAETGRILDRMKQAYMNYYNRLEPDTIHQIKQYIEGHSHENISLETICIQVGLSPSYVSKLFKEQLGINYIDFLTECRIEKAKKLIADPEKSFKEITFEVGYHDPNYFSKVFKRMCELSPKQYRKVLLQGNRD
ncbi:response regulator [Paenibacillus sp. LHD-117]|uniref:response regulator n=1 Tax=Paenibacillus sp. LHD-117 TaxID=3071412 RepID=UPI0027DF4FF5|nr:response regulator [Paenibacillus sp. LHD-117]MDQ6417929.1 response regulator [Paenibacillus sp. LHD-117]